jgi:hypothetical protein
VIVPRTQRSTKWCAADPGPTFCGNLAAWVPAQRCTARALHRVRDTSSRRCDYFFTIAHAGSGGPNASSPGILARIV